RRRVRARLSGRVHGGRGCAHGRKGIGRAAGFEGWPRFVWHLVGALHGIVRFGWQLTHVWLRVRPRPEARPGIASDRRGGRGPPRCRDTPPPPPRRKNLPAATPAVTACSGRMRVFGQEGFPHTTRAELGGNARVADRFADHARCSLSFSPYCQG